jgi:hypothetical protein
LQIEYGVPFLRLLLSDDFFSDFATFLGSFDLNTFDFRSKASLFSVTLADYRLDGRFPVFFAPLLVDPLLAGVLFAIFLVCCS